MLKQSSRTIATLILGRPKPVRVTIGLLLSSTIGWHLPLLTLSLVGGYPYVAEMWAEGFSRCILLLVVNLIGYETKRPLVTAFAFCAIIGLYETQIAWSLRFSNIAREWQPMFVPLCSIPLSALIFSWYMSAARLNENVSKTW